MNALSGELRTRVDGLGKHLALWVSHTDPPGNKRLRESVQKPFVTRSVLAMRDRVTAIANELVDAVVVSGRMDVISDFAYLMPVTVICERMGIPPEDSTRFQAWVEGRLAERAIKKRGGI
jgi:cytochrome P450 PksS